jgi:hypothetical protein
LQALLGGLRPDRTNERGGGLRADVRDDQSLFEFVPERAIKATRGKDACERAQPGRAGPGRALDRLLALTKDPEQSDVSLRNYLKKPQTDAFVPSALAGEALS